MLPGHSSKSNDETVVLTKQFYFNQTITRNIIMYSSRASLRAKAATAFSAS